MHDHVVVDVEIAHTIEEVGGWDNTDKMGISVACLWEYQTQRVRVYGPEDDEELRARLLRADRISGYNIFNFDFPVIWGISKQEWLGPPVGKGVVLLKGKMVPKTNDLLRRIWRALGFDPDRWQAGMGGAKLDDIAGATIGARKIGNGADAPRWYQAGQVQRVVNYCADDICIERDLTDFIDRYGYVIYRGVKLPLNQ